MSTLFTSLTDEFDSVAGSFTGNFDADNHNGKHLDIRSFHSDTIFAPRTMLDLRLSNASALNGIPMANLDIPRTVTGTIFISRQISTIDVLNMASLDMYSMFNLDFAIGTGGNEGWPTGDPDVTFGPDSGHGYMNTIRVTLLSGVSKTVTSTFVDNLLVGYEDATDYVIELALPSFPATLDTSNSWIDFTSDAGYAAGKTDSFRFSDSLTSLSGTNVYWRINRSSLVNCQLSNIIGIRFRLLATTNVTFTAAAMRMYSLASSYFGNTFNLSIDTKRNYLYKQIPENGNSTTTTSSVKYIISSTRPKNGKFVIKFNTGNQSSSNSTITLFKRSTSTAKEITALLNFSTTASQIQVKDSSGTLNSTSGSHLTDNTEYYLTLEIYETQVRATINLAFGSFLGSQVITTGWRSLIDTPDRGVVGLTFSPVNYNSYIDYISSGDAEFARYSSNVFTRISNTTGATISTQTTPPIDLTEGLLVSAGDATVSLSSTVGFPNPPSSHIVRDGSQWSGGLTTNSPIFIGNPQYIKVSGNILPTPATGSALRGSYRIVFTNKYTEAGFISVIQNLLPNQWNHFEIPINTNMAVSNYYISLQQTGFYADSFYLSNFQVNHLSVAWEISPDNTNYFPFLTAKDTQFSAANFVSNPGNNLVVRAKALSDTAWVKGYELIPYFF